MLNNKISWNYGILLNDRDKNYGRLLANYLLLIHFLPCTSIVDVVINAYYMNIFQFQFQFAFHEYENTVKDLSVGNNYPSKVTGFWEKRKKYKKYALKHSIFFNVKSCSSQD